MTTRSADPATKDFVEQLAVLLHADGMPRVAGRMFAVLLMSAEPWSLDDLAAKLRVSKPSISVNARLLEEKGVVARVSLEGDRRDYYRIADDILERSLEQRIARWRRFHQAIAGARQHCRITHDVVRERLEAMDQLYQQMLDVTMRALDQWRARETGHGTPDTTR